MTGTTIHYEKPQHACISIEKPQVAHGPAIHRLVAACKPLDLNSRYAYLLLCEHFARTCVIARDPSLDTEFPDTSLVEAVQRNVEDGAHFEWQMRPQVVAALRALNF